MGYVTRFTLTAATSIVFAATAIAGVEHSDIGVFVVNDRIRTGELHKGEFESIRVFGSEFGEGGIFNFTDEPGFEAEDGTFPPDTFWGFNILAPLGLWNGAGFDDAPNSLTVSFGPNEVTTSNGFVEGFFMQTDDEGGLHEHLGFTLNGVDMSSDPGVYLLELELKHSDDGIGPGGGIGDSPPFWLVFNFMEDEAVHDEAIKWVEANLVPAPGAFALLGAAAFFARRRHRC